MSNNVLVVDDSISLHKLVKAYLLPDQLTVHSAYDGESGLLSAVNLQPSVIILDVDMPRLNGFEVCRRLKGDSVTASIPVIFLTASSMLDNRVMGLNVGASDYISKPFKPDEFRARVRASLRARNQMESATLVDKSTGLWSRAYLDGHLDFHGSLAKRFGVPLACLVAEIEVDSGELLLDQPGEADASDILRTMARVFSGRCRAEDVICRVDARKFAILVTGANKAAADVLARRLGDEVKRQMQHRHNSEIEFNYGIADTSATDAGKLFDRADAAVSGTRHMKLNPNLINRDSIELMNAVA